MNVDVGLVYLVGLEGELLIWGSDVERSCFDDMIDGIIPMQ